MQYISRKSVVTIIVFTLSVLLIWYGLVLYGRRGLDKIIVVALPSDSTITIDGNEAKNGTNYVEPGTHTVTASRVLFDPVTTTVDTTKNGDKPVYLLPAANSDAAKQWLADNPAVQLEIEGVVGSLDAQKQQAIQEKYPILSKLPYETEHFKIDYSLNGENSDEPAYTVSLYAIINSPSQYASYQAQLRQYRDEALQFLTNNSVDVNNTLIKFTPDDF